MNNINIIAQCIGVLGIITYVIMYQLGSMKKIRLAKLAMDCFWGAHYLLLGATAGFVANAVCFVREIVFIKSDKPGFDGRKWLCLFVSVNIISAIITWKGLYSGIPAVVSVLGTYGFWQKKVSVARVLALICNILMFTYNLFIASYAGLAGETLAFVSVVIALINQRKKLTD
jgi:hypothetical protein